MANPAHSAFSRKRISPSNWQDDRDEAVFTTDQVAKKLHIGTSTVVNFCNNGQLKYFSRGRGYYIRQDELEEFMNEHHIPRNIEHQEVYSVREAAKIMGMGRATIIRLCDSGLLKHYKINTHRYIPQNFLADFMRQHQIPESGNRSIFKQLIYVGDEVSLQPPLTSDDITTQWSTSMGAVLALPPHMQVIRAKRMEDVVLEKKSIPPMVVADLSSVSSAQAAYEQVEKLASYEHLFVVVDTPESQSLMRELVRSRQNISVYSLRTAQDLLASDIGGKLGI